MKVLDIDRDRQRISLGLKQTQEDPWQRVVDTYNLGDELEGTVTKVVTFGAFVEILDGVEGLVHISELAHHHVENPREVVNQGDKVRVKILEIDSERRRLSLSLKRVEDQILPLREGAPPPDDASERGARRGPRPRPVGGRLRGRRDAGRRGGAAAEEAPAGRGGSAGRGSPGEAAAEDPPAETHPDADEAPAEGEDQPA